MKNDLDNEVNKKKTRNQYAIPGQCNTGAGPLSDFYKIRHGEGFPGS